MKSISKSFMTLMAVAMMLSCERCSGEAPYNGARPASEPVSALKEAPFPFGAAVTPALLYDNAQYATVVKRELNSLTGENAMKMDMISKGYGLYDWTGGDRVAQFARDNGMRIHGHTLVWYRSLPNWWMDNFSGDRDAWIALLTTYITDVVTHFKAQGVTSWDVVNEAFEDDGSWRHCVWYDNIGQDYMDIAFQTAHAADPDALLFYNDYGMEYSAAKRVAICNEMKAMLGRGIPIDGIGLQMHVNVNTPKYDMVAALDAAAELNLKIHISELDVAVNDINRPDPTLTFTDELKEKQKTAYKSMVEAYRALPSDLQFGITLWGVHDAQAWLAPNPDWPLPFDKDFNKKLAYDGIIEALERK